MNKKNCHRSKSGSNLRKPSGRKNYFTRKNQKKSNKKAGSTERTKERRRLSMRK